MDTLKSMCKGTIIAIAISIVSILIFMIATVVWKRRRF